MRTLSTLSPLRNKLRAVQQAGQRIGLVPTMGAFHEGHLSLIRAARRETDYVVVSVFVNPIQFDRRDDFRRYPRPRLRDQKLAAREHVDLLFAPTAKTMYPDGLHTTVSVPTLTSTLCGETRPGHFDGVAVVVSKLLNLITPDRTYFGDKDFQQAVMVRRLVHDLNWPTMVRTLPTIRESDGLALSSRNRRLTRAQRQRAVVLWNALQGAADRIRAGERSVASLKRAMRRDLRRGTPTTIDYADVVSASTLQALTRVRGEVLLAGAVWFGRVRLIDSLRVKVQSKRRG